MKLTKFLLPVLTAVPLVSGAQHIKEGYVDWGIRGTQFPAAFEKWEKGQKWTDDDNFFISRVKPKERFRNTATQVNPSLDDRNDKKLIFWVPINSPEFNALPDGVYDREVFPMWSYVTHYGNWSTSLVRMPGNFIDVAHKNGVPVSVVAGIPWGNITDEWDSALRKLLSVGPEKMADYLEFYGIDGLGYNSEFQGDKAIPNGLADYHARLIKLLKPTGRMPLAENIWYDGTDESGRINFDQGLGTHNDDLWGYGDNIKTSLFFNYNWNNNNLLDKTVRHAATVGRTPLDLYCGINMQGREPHNYNPEIWTMLVDRPLSIGLWGAHSENMFFESRAEKGTTPDVQQRTYMLRMERWFTGGSRNPINTPELSNSLKMVADNYDFFGMSKMMSARSALKWDLGEEPFITYFNLGNGKFFNYKGVRQHSKEWYNIGMQDYLPTWMWWFSDKFLGRTAADAPATGLDAEFVWDDAWMGGSLVRVFGSTPSEYLHLFKTEFGIRRGDVITVRYKVLKGSADAYLALSVKGKEDTPVDESKFRVMHKAFPHEGFWRTATFVVNDELSALEGKDLAMVALHFKNADNLDVRLGEFSIVRGDATSEIPATPVLDKAELLAANHTGADGKVIFHVPNNKENGVCYNIDVKTSLFKLYSRQEGKEPVLMGMTPSWAGLIFSAPLDHSVKGAKIAFGVSALSLDMSKESEIAWSDYYGIDDIYEYNDDIKVDRSLITPGEPFTVSYVDPLHETGTWELTDSEGTTLATTYDSNCLEMSNGLRKAGNYHLTITGVAQKGDSRKEVVREFPAFIQVTDSEMGRLPEIVSLTANGEEESVHVDCGSTVEMAYEGHEADGKLSRGLRVKDAGLGFAYKDTGCENYKPFSVSFWIKPEDFKNKAVHMLNIRDKGDAWANNNWGWFWHTLNEDGSFEEFVVRGASGTNISYNFGDVKLLPGVWQHVTYVFDFNDVKGVKPSFYLNGKEIPLKSYVRGTQTFEGDNMEYERRTYAWRDNNVVAVGGYLHKSGSVRANMDNLMFWNKALTAEEIQTAMGNIDPENIPENLLGYFDFESEPDETGAFANAGKGTFTAGMHDYEATEVEGQGTLVWKQPEYCAGSPFISGKVWEIKTEPEWRVIGGNILSSEGDGKSGKAQIKFPIDGTFNVELCLRNEYGEASKVFPIKVGTAGVESVFTAEEISAVPNPFETELNVSVQEGGDYVFSLYDAEGRLLFRKGATLSAGESTLLRPGVGTGIYLLSISRDGQNVNTQKVVRR